MKAILPLALLAACFLGAMPASAVPREWKTADGSKTINAEFVSSKGGDVTIRRATDQKIFTIALATLSEADRKWVADTLAKEEEASAKSDKGSEFAKLLTGEWERTEGHGLPYRIYGARKLRGADEKGYPLVIYLHGRNGDVMTPEQPNEARSFSEEENYRKRSCIIIAPQCPKDGSSWDGKNADAVLEIIEDLTKNLAVDKKRIYLTGYSMGGYGTFYLLNQEPKLFAAGVPVAGGGNPNTAENFKNVPVWVFHGAKDEDVKVEQSKRMVEALQKEKAEVKYTEYPDAGHGSSGQVYADTAMHEWLFGQVK